MLQYRTKKTRPVGLIINLLLLSTRIVCDMIKNMTLSLKNLAYKKLQRICLDTSVYINVSNQIHY